MVLELCCFEWFQNAHKILCCIIFVLELCCFEWFQNSLCCYPASRCVLELCCFEWFQNELEVSVIKFPNLESAEFWLNKEQYDFRDRFIFDSEEKAFGHLTELKGYDWAKVALEDADTLTLLKNGEFDIEMSDSYIAKMMP